MCIVVTVCVVAFCLMFWLIDCCVGFGVLLVLCFVMLFCDWCVCFVCVSVFVFVMV